MPSTAVSRAGMVRTGARAHREPATHHPGPELDTTTAAEPHDPGEAEEEHDAPH